MTDHKDPKVIAKAHDDEPILSSRMFFIRNQYGFFVQKDCLCLVERDSVFS